MRIRLFVYVFLENSNVENLDRQTLKDLKANRLSIFADKIVAWVCAVWPSYDDPEAATRS